MRALSLAALLFLAPLTYADLTFTLTQDGFASFGGRVATDVDVVSPKLKFGVAPDARVFVNGLPGWTCTTTTNPVECTIALLPAGSQHDILVNILGAPGHYTLTAEANEQRIEIPFAIPRGRTINSAPSLYEAVEWANATCTDDIPCLIYFDIHVESGPQTLSFTTPLPPITACDLTIFSPRRPPDLSDLRHTVTGTGLVVMPQCEKPRFTMFGFDLSTYRDIGVYVNAPRSAITIQNVSISNMNRSAITLWSAGSSVLDNVEARGNRASGVFVGPSGGAVTLRNSTLRDSAHFGLALAHGNASVTLENTRIFGNRAGDIDRGLDGPTDRAPVILSKTANSVTVDPRGAGSIEVWTSDALTMFGTAGLEHFVGRTTTNGEPVTITGELRGKFAGAIRVEEGRVTEVSPAP